MADMDRQVIAISADIHQQLNPFYNKIDQSSKLSDDIHRRYGRSSLYSVTYRLPFALLLLLVVDQCKKLLSLKHSVRAT